MGVLNMSTFQKLQNVSTRLRDDVMLDVGSLRFVQVGHLLPVQVCEVFSGCCNHEKTAAPRPGQRTGQEDRREDRKVDRRTDGGQEEGQEERTLDRREDRRSNRRVDRTGG